MISTRDARPLRRRFQRFFGDRRGAAALEFALVGFPFIVMLVAILQLALDFVLFSQVDYLNSNAQVRIRGGEVTIQALDADTFKQRYICPNLTMLPCGPLAVNVITVKAWWDATGWNNSAAWKPGAIDVANAKFCPGGSADVVFMQFAYPIPFGSMLWSGDKNLADGKRFYLSTTAFRNDPYGLPGNTRAGC